MNQARWWSQFGGEDGSRAQRGREDCRRGLLGTSSQCQWGGLDRAEQVFPTWRLLSLLLQQLTISKKNTDWSWPNDCLILLSDSLLSKQILAVLSLEAIQCLQFLPFHWRLPFFLCSFWGIFLIASLLYTFICKYIFPKCPHTFYAIYYMLVHFYFLRILPLLFLLISVGSGGAVTGWRWSKGTNIQLKNLKKKYISARSDW